jgi:hypothetical protein
MSEKIWEEQAQNWIALARSGEDSYWFYRDLFFELMPEPASARSRLGVEREGWRAIFATEGTRSSG